MQSSHPFTCNTCQVAFRSSDLQRTHMQSDWHRYNLKRRVASLPPLSSEIFAEKVLANKASAAATAAKASYEKLCSACQKTYYSEGAYHNHLASQRHRLLAASAARNPSGDSKADDDATSVMSSTFSLGEPIETASNVVVDGDAEAEFSKVVDSIKDASLDDADPLSPRRPSRPHHSSVDERPAHPLSPTTTRSSALESGASVPRTGPLLDCLFCNYTSPSFKLNLNHMEKQHGMYIPEQDYLVDPEGLINYLHWKIYEIHECLYCGIIRNTTVGIQTHMRDKGHCMIAFGSEDEQLEVGQFYDFRSTYPEGEGSDTDEDDVSTEGEEAAKGGVKLGARRTSQTITDAAGGGGGGGGDNDDGWETDSTVSDVPTEELGSVYAHDRSASHRRVRQGRHYSHTDARPHRSADGYHSHAHPVPHAVIHDDFELHLPTGRVAGHRSLARYYRQNLRDHPSPAERAEMRALAEASLAEAGSEDDGEGEGSALQQQQGERGRGRAMVSRANGGLGMVGVAEAKKREVRAVEKRERRREMEARARYQWGNEKRGNLQKHFRDPLLQ